MKILRNLLFVLSIAAVFSSCSDDDGYSLDKFWLSLGTIEGTQDSYTVLTDHGDRLFPSANAVPGFEVEDGMRVWVNYTILGDATGEITYYVKINNLSEVLTKGIIELTPENADSIGNDALTIDDYSFTNQFLNVAFSYGGGGTIHFINLVTDVDNPTTPDGMPILEVMHNKNGDPYNYLRKGLVSFDLTELEEAGKTEVTFLLRAKGKTGEYEFEQELTYEYGTVTP
ncbi:MAG: NigD-like N-terminal domain-containing protein [Marinilabiliaceae bacterium]|nr:NigD-like N-terminal domain-containing protein [Marinilabiliaceae bacterium]